MYPKMLQFTPVIQESYAMTLARNSFLPLVSTLMKRINVGIWNWQHLQVITRGSDQVAVSSRFEVRNDPAVVRNFGSILVEYSKIVPDGVVAFFPSYLYMESIVAAWNDMVWMFCSTPSLILLIGCIRRAYWTRCGSTSSSSWRLQMRTRRVLHWRTTAGWVRRFICELYLPEISVTTRLATMDAALYFFPSPEARFLKVSTSTTIMEEP